MAAARVVRLILSLGYSKRACMQERWPLKWTVHILLECKGGMHGRGCAWLGRAWQGDMGAEETATEAGDTHPTGMHSGFSLILYYINLEMS